jgi:two-component system sensor histidine kinase UhpB
MLRWWREAHPDVAVEMAITADIGAMNDTVELTIYRVVQEALTNVFRHAGATRVTVTISSEYEAVLVRVQDDGTGLAADHHLGFGLTGMRERVLALGGTLEVTSAEQGVTVQAVIPAGNHADATPLPAAITRESGRSR